MQSNQYTTKVGGHITLLFSIQSKSIELDEQGSRGVGICIEKGVEVSTAAQKGNGKVVVTSDVENLSVKLYNLIIEEMSKDFEAIKEFDWEFLIKSDLPFSQGFACSASGALSAIICILKIIKVVESGLGDVTALSSGGGELRGEPGLPFPPNKGEIISLKLEFPMILCWEKNKQKHTSEYIDDENWKKSISDAGEKCISALKQKEWDKNIWNDLLEQSKTFGKSSGILFDSNRKEILHLIEGILKNLQLNDLWKVRLCMLGSSAVILPKDIENYNYEELEQILKGLKKVKLNSCITKTNINPIEF